MINRRCYILGALTALAFVSIFLSFYAFFDDDDVVLSKSDFLFPATTNKALGLEKDYAHQKNPRPSDIRKDSSLYKTSLKDYTGERLRTNKGFPAILGYKSATTRDSMKVVGSVPNNHIFICYSNHGTSTGLDLLKTENASAAYKTLVFHLQLKACGSEGIFRGLRDGLNIYATKSASADENNIKNYCLGEMHRPPPGYQVCSGELIEDSDNHNRRTQYLLKKTVQHPFGDLKPGKEKLLTYMGTNLKNDKRFILDINPIPFPSSRSVGQPDAGPLYYFVKYLMASEGSAKRIEAQKQLFKVLSHRLHVHDIMQVIGKLLFGESGPEVLKTVRNDGISVDDFHCYKNLSRMFEKHCGSLSETGHTLSIANICDAGISEEQMSEAVAQVCVKLPVNPWNYVFKGLGGASD